MTVENQGREMRLSDTVLKIKGIDYEFCNFKWNCDARDCQYNGCCGFSYANLSRHKLYVQSKKLNATVYCTMIAHGLFMKET